MRYFLVTYIATDAKLSSTQVTGNAYFNCEDFPSNRDLRERVIPIAAQKNLSNIVVTNIFEFKSEHDFEAFKK